MTRSQLVLGLFAALAALGGCGGSSAAVDAKVDPAVCKEQLEAQLDRACAAPADCVLVDSADCCGTIKLAVRAGTQAGFPAAESRYVACLACPLVGCAHADLAEDGMAAGVGQSIVPICDQGRCKSAVR